MHHSKLNHSFTAWIPNHCSNHTILKFYDILRKLQFPRTGKSRNHDVFCTHLPQIQLQKGYIENQNDYTDMHYGKVTMAYAGCEIIAAYNALVSLGAPKAENLPEMIESFQRDGMVLSGRFGTAPNALTDYFKNCGFQVFSTSDTSKFNQIGERAEALLLTFYNDRTNIFEKIHTIHISKESGGYIAHNLHGDGFASAVFSSVSELMDSINQGKAKGILLIGIRH